MADAEHSLFSASGGDGWSVCHGKPAMEEGRKGTSEYADEGTAAHELGKWVMTARIGGRDRTAADYIGTKIEVARFDAKTKKKGKRVFVVDSDMAEHVDDYVDRFFLISQARQAERFCEQRVYYHDYLGVPKQLAWGTSDGVAILFDQPALAWKDAEGELHHFPPGDELQIHDLKYGAGVTVWADTLQAFLYGAGTYYAWEHVANFTRVRLVIHQPRKEHFDELVITPQELLERVRGLRPSVPRVLEAYELARELREVGMSDLEVGTELHRKGYLKPGEKACRFCDGKAVCPAIAEDVAEAVSGKRASPEDFEDLTVDTPEEVREYGGNYLAAAFDRLELIEDWMKAIRAEIERRVLIKGEKIAGVKVVQGRQGRRAWTSQGEVELFVQGLPGPLRELMYERKIKNPAQAEKSLKTSPMTWAKLQPLIDRAEGRKSVAPLSDKRAAVSHKAKAEEFEDLTAEDDETPAQRKGPARAVTAHPFR